MYDVRINNPLEHARSQLDFYKKELAYAQEQVQGWEKRIAELTPPFAVGDTVTYATGAGANRLTLSVLAMNMSFDEWVVKSQWPNEDKPIYLPARLLKKLENADDQR